VSSSEGVLRKIQEFQMVPAGYPWPKRGNKAFIQARRGREVHLPSIQPRFSEFPQHAAAFKTAAEIMIDACESNSRVSHPDHLFFPIAFLYRHCLELKLKDLIHVGISMRFFNCKDMDWVRAEHGLAQLWTPVKALLIDGWPNEDPTSLRATEAVIAELHRADPNGQNFRYDSDPKGHPRRYENLPDFINLSNLRSTMDNVYAYLECCESCLRDNLSGWNGP
jgi:hypothetical protein